MTSHKLTGLLRASVVILALTLFLPTVFAETDDSTKTTKTEQTSSDSSLSGAKTGITEEGSFRATTPNEERELFSKLKKTLMKYPGHEPKFGANGSISLIVAPHRMGFTVATMGPDGKVNYSCADHAKDHDQTATSGNQVQQAEE